MYFSLATNMGNLPYLLPIIATYLCVVKCYLITIMSKKNRVVWKVIDYLLLCKNFTIHAFDKLLSMI